MNGTTKASTTWYKDLPYIIQSSAFTVASGTTLTVNHGTIIKSTSTSLNAGLNVAANGALDVQGTAGDPVYFTALSDDSSETGGDTNEMVHRVRLPRGMLDMFRLPQTQKQTVRF